MKIFLTSGFEGVPEVARAVHQYLMHNGIPVWYDYPIYSGEDSPPLAEQLQQFYDESDLVVILLTKLSNEGSFFHEGEWPAALRTKTPVLLLDLSDNAATSFRDAPGIMSVSCSDEKEVPELVLKYVQSRKKHRLFISYSRKDEESAVQLTRRLEASLNKVWIDRSDVNQGEKFPEKIAKAIESCEYFVLLWSANSRSSRWVEREWNHAFKLGKSVLPILLDDTPLPMVLEDTHGFLGLSDPSLNAFFDISQ